MSFKPQDRLGPYEILGPIGAGGMSEVYKARDTRLDRTVAVKVSAEQFSERFEREAHAIAALNHPRCLISVEEIAELLKSPRRRYCVIGSRDKSGCSAWPSLRLDD